MHIIWLIYLINMRIIKRIFYQELLSTEIMRHSGEICVVLQVEIDRSILIEQLLFSLVLSKIRFSDENVGSDSKKCFVSA
jgi:hypothetical protein